MMRFLTLLVTAVLQLGNPAQQSISARVEGRVIDALTGLAVPNVTVSRGPGGQGVLAAVVFESVSLGTSAVYGGTTAITDSEGRFVLESVPPGALVLAASRLGYVDFRSDRYFGGDSGRSATLTPGQVLKDVVIRILPAAIAYGRVIDIKGDPVSAALVYAFRNGYDDLGAVKPVRAAALTTDDRGEFRFNTLPPGTYGFQVERNLVRFGQPNPVSYYATYYPGVPDSERATMIDLEAGKETRLRDILLMSGRGGSLSVRILRDTDVGPSTQVVVWRDGESSDTANGSLPPEGGVLGPMPPGTYQIEVDTGRSRGYARAELGQQDLTVEVFVPNPAVIVGRAGVGDPRDPENFQPVQGVRLQILDTFANNSANRPTLISAADGRFTNPPFVKPGLFHVQSFNVPDGTYLEAVRFGSKDVFGEKFSIDRGSVDLNLILGEGPGVVRGTVRDERGFAVPGAVVALLPEDRAQKALVVSKTADGNGVFELRCAPGSYRIYAWPQLDGAAYRNAEFMEPFNDHGKPLRIRNNERLNVDLQILSRPVTTTQD